MMQKAILTFRIFGEQKARLLLASQNQQHGLLLPDFMNLGRRIHAPTSRLICINLLGERTVEPGIAVRRHQTVACGS
jgi:hypothetical protein